MPQERFDATGGKKEKINSALRISPPSTPQASPLMSPIETKSSRKHWDRIYRWWIWELFCWTLASACLCRIAGILSKWDGKPLDEWHSSLTLNSILAILSSISKAALLVPVSAGISQLKWSRLDDRRSLIDLQRFDEASRGPLGSIRLIWRGGIFTAIGTLVIIAGLATDPFIQQVVLYPTTSVETETFGSMPRTLTYEGFVRGGGTAPTFNPSDEMRAAIFTGMFTNGTNVVPVCPTGNCTWPEFDSVAVCSTCNDITQHMEIRRATWNDSSYGYPHESCEMSLPNAVTLNYTNDYSPWYSLNLTRGTVVTDELAHLQSTIVNFTALFSNTQEGPNCTQRDADTRAVECSIYWCMQKYNTSMTNSILNEHASSLRPMVYSNGDSNDLFSSLHLNEPSATFTVSNSVPAAVQLYMEYEIFESGNSTKSNHYNYESTSDMIRLLRTASAQSGVAGISKSLTTLTRTMTTSVRTSPYTNDTGPPVIGTLQQQVRFIHVRWPWLILQTGLDLLAIVFLLGVIVQTLRTKTEVWKSSQVAMIFRGLNTRDLMDVETSGRLVDMEYHAKRVHVKLRGSDLDREDKRLVKIA